MEAVTDTNALVYDTIADSVFHQEARDKLERLDRWVIPTVVIEELVLTYHQLGITEEVIHTKLLELLESRRVNIIPVQKEDIRKALSIIEHEKASFTQFNDKLILSMAKRVGSPLLTFDKKLRTQSNRLGIRLVK